MGLVMYDLEWVGTKHSWFLGLRQSEGMALGKEKRVECQGAGRGRFFSFPPAANPLCSPGLGDLVSGGEASDAQSQASTLTAKIGKPRPTVRGGGAGWYASGQGHRKASG